MPPPAPPMSDDDLDAAVSALSDFADHLMAHPDDSPAVHLGMGLAALVGAYCEGKDAGDPCGPLDSLTDVIARWAANRRTPNGLRVKDQTGNRENRN